MSRGFESHTLRCVYGVLGLLAGHEHGRLGAGGHAELSQDCRHVHARCLDADEKPPGYLPVAQSFGEEREHLALAGGELCECGSSLAIRLGESGAGSECRDVAP